MTPAELQQALRSVEPATVLVSPRVLENIIRQTVDVRGFLWSVPHRKSFVIDRQTLFRHVEQEELTLGVDQLLPQTVILLAWPDAEELEESDRGQLLRKYWQRLFHASVHLTIENRLAEGKLTPAGIRERIERLGPARLEEIRTVLVQDRYLAPDPDERGLYIEFAAVFLELKYFSNHLLATYFPIIRDVDEIDKLLGQDVDADALYERTRPAGATESVPMTASSSQEAHEYYWKLVRSSDQALQRGNVVLAAIQRRRAARVAPVALGYATRQTAVTELLGLVDRLQKALDLPGAEVEEWRKHLPTLLDKADQGRHAAEAALLYDLQKVCLDHECEIYSLDVVEWAMSAGKRPIKRHLPRQRAVRVARTLRGTIQRLTMARLSDEHRNEFASLLLKAVHRSENEVREEIRPQLTTSLQDVGLSPHHPLEATASRKVVEELLDRVLVSGFVTFSELRDTLSRNQLKLPDLTDPQDFIRGDPLLRLDRLLASRLDGVYRPSEFYLRWLERLTAPNFGTHWGRLLTLYVTVPFLGALLILEGVSKALIALDHQELPDVVFYPILALLSFFLIGLLHSADLRQRFVQIGKAMARPLRAMLVDGPLWLVEHTSLKEVTESWPFQIFYWYAFKPLLLAALIAIFFPRAYDTLFSAAMVFLASMFFVNSRPGQAVGEAIVQTLRSFVELLQAGLIPGLFSLVIQLFKHILHLGDALLFKVDEWLRFRGGESPTAMTLRVILGLLWFPIAYLIRFNVVVLIEPCLNPLKLPIASIATKIMLPLLYYLKDWLPQQLNPVMGSFLGNALSWWIVFWLPDAVAFVIWEMKENWSLYQANRRPALRPVVLGTRGETMRGLLQAGFHSGTVPRLYARLRQAERKARQSGSWSSVRACHSALAEVEEAVYLFVTREFCELLAQTPAWQGQSLRVGRVALATNQIRLELLHPDYPELVMVLEFENQAGKLVAGIASPGWLDKLPTGQRSLLHNALATLYKLAGVDQVREQTPPKGSIEKPADELNLAQRTFQQIPITWEECVKCWQPNSTTLAPTSLLGDGIALFTAPWPNHPEIHPESNGAIKE